ncbi:MAG: MFS transporter [Anaeromyxobacteraceae bacterium]
MPTSAAGRSQPQRREAYGMGALMAEGLLSRLSFGVVSFALPLYARRLGISLTDIGILIGLNGAIAIAIKPLCGWATDRFGPRRILLTAVALRSLVSLLLVFAVSLGHLYAIRALHGVAMGLRDPAAGVLLAGGAEKRVASRFAWYQSAKQMGGNLGRSVAGLLIGLTASRYPLVFLAAFALSALPLVAVFLSVHDPVDEATKQPAAGAAVARAQPLGAMRARVFAYAGLGVLVAGTANMLTQLFPLIATEYAHLTPAQAGVIFLVGSVFGVVGGPIFGWVSDHVGPRHVLMVRGVANTVSSVLYLVFPTLVGIAIAKATDDLGKAAFRPAWGSIMATVAKEDPKTRARTISLLGMGEDLGELAGPLVAGALWSAWGIGALIAVRVALAVVSEVYAIVVCHRPAPRAAPGDPAAAGSVAAVGG